jgi:hypothetical protein
MSGLVDLIRQKAFEIIQEISELPKEEVNASAEWLSAQMSEEDAARCERLSLAYECDYKIAVVAFATLFEFFDAYESQITWPSRYRN